MVYYFTARPLLYRLASGEHPDHKSTDLQRTTFIENIRMTYPREQLPIKIESCELIERDREIYTELGCEIVYDGGKSLKDQRDVAVFPADLRDMLDIADTVDMEPRMFGSVAYPFVAHVERNNPVLQSDVFMSTAAMLKRGGILRLMVFEYQPSWFEKRPLRVTDLLKI